MLFRQEGMYYRGTCFTGGHVLLEDMSFMRTFLWQDVSYRRTYLMGGHVSGG